MDSNRFDALVRRMATRPSRRQMVGVFVAALVGGRLGTTLADERTAVSGNGGDAAGSADGGAVRLGEINSGGNAGVAVDIGDTIGDVDVHGGTVGNATNIDVAADGGVGIADGSGGDGNVAVVVEPGPEADDTEDEDEDEYPYDDLYDGEYDGEAEDAETEGAEGEYPDPDDGGTEPDPDAGQPDPDPGQPDPDPGQPDPGQPDPSPTQPPPSPTPGTTPPPAPSPSPTVTPPTVTPVPPPTATPLPTATPVPTATATPTPTPCPCANSNHSYCPGAQGKPNGCCPTPSCGQNRQSGAVCCNCGMGQCECVAPICTPS